ncbi:uncharacterized protein LOC122403528 [Colletes gigas]|uniref:uncharacterized protein LOC122403528 n=1 Tax=Colletes gigas TaxID=935657 RepID=UPI001C9B0DDD|nr:uncharacterized protein LOC122403528 [Colletes gigas]
MATPREDTLNKLVEERGRVKSSLTRFKTCFETQRATTGAAALEERLHRNLHLLDRFESIQDRIDAITAGTPEEHTQNQIREAFENAYFDIIGAVREHVSAKRAPVPNPSSTAQQTFRVDAASPTASVAAPSVRLPSVPLPSFHGTVGEWVYFRDSFESLINQNTVLSNIERFHYLRSAVKGDAARALKALPMSDENYTAAWKLLCERYEDTNELIDFHVGALFDLPTLPKDSPASLRQLLDDFNNNLKSLTSLEEPVEKWDTILVHLLATKLDRKTSEAWDKRVAEIGRKKTLADLQTFLEKQYKILIKSVRVIPPGPFPPKNRNPGQKPQPHPMTLVSMQSLECPLCSSDHPLTQCKRFKALTPYARFMKVKEFRICFNCLRPGHGSNTCNKGNCHKCNGNHHTLIHLKNDSTPTVDPVVADPVVSIANAVNNTPPQSYATHDSSGKEHVLLSTAIIHVLNDKGQKFECRALLDQGSQVNIIKESFAKFVGLSCKPTQLAISGVGAADAGKRAQGKARVTIQSRQNGYSTTMSCILMQKITSDIPNFKIAKSALNIPANVRLADPSFDKPRDVDMLIGNGHLWEIMSVGQKRLGQGLPVLLKSQFGWVFGGKIRASLNAESQSCNVVTNDQLNSQLTRFWDIEQIPTLGHLPAHPCEEHFNETVKRDSDGRFIVTIPFNSDLAKLGDSYSMAERRFFGLERKLNRTPVLKAEYVSFMSEYLALGHMTQVSRDSRTQAGPAYYLPHHAVTKAASTTTKMRVVFDGSAKTSSGYSLNDTQEIGPVVQDDLFSILIRFRQHQIILSADIAKMYRQILVAPEQRVFQRILWREEPTLPLETYELNTVTYGTASAPFLATCVLRQIGLDQSHLDPVISLPLRKWASNVPAVVQEVLTESRDLNLQAEKDPKTLGLLWEPCTDELRVSVESQPVLRTTKRTILSEVSKIFDPLGLVAPVIIQAKLIIQSLWQLKLSWDESVPQAIHSEFHDFYADLRSLTRLAIPRCVLCPNPVQVEMHGFCDASERAFGACIYLRTISETGKALTQLLCAKTRVAPLKTISLPRLELCGALLLAQLVNKVRVASRSQKVQEFYWTDSMIALAWIKGSPNRWKTFVANRVSEIQTLSTGPWNHVLSGDNPADLLSRGVKPSALDKLSFWWNGPSWLAQPSTEWPITGSIPAEVPEERAISCIVIREIASQVPGFLLKFSNYTRLLRVIAYCLKFYHTVKHRVSLRNNRTTRPWSTQLTVQDLDLAEVVILRLVQGNAFTQELSDLRKNQTVTSNSPLRSLNPFIDDKGLIRVGGRLANAELKYYQQHQVILPKNHHVTRMIIRRAHERVLHAGCETVLSMVRTRYWPLTGRNLTKGIIRTCVKCNRAAPKGTSYLMGQLPAPRIRIRPPFFSTGVDYAGPFYLKERVRSKTTTKAYLCVFICLATKAVHLEVASDLSTDAFLNALKRFVARRGRCREIYSDNGTNFVGARNEMQRIKEFFADQKRRDTLSEFTVTEGMQWHFIPPYSPHFGGLWESCVKSAKRLLTRVVGETRLTFEELATVLAQIEACLNSRPLCPVSTDPTDLNPLTPGHFLTGSPLMDLPYPDVTDVKPTRLSRFQLLQAMSQHFWKRWQLEYLHQLQQRHKWKIAVPEGFGVGTMVVIKDASLPPLRWKLGRITALHPGTDQITRVVSIRTADGVIKRPVAKICILPTEDESSSPKDQPGSSVNRDTKKK